MADTTNPEMLGLDRQRAMAQMLLKRGMETPQGQMIGNRYVGAHPLQFIGGLAQQYVAQNELKDIDTEQAALAKKLKGIGSIESEDVLTTLMGQQGRPELVQQGPTSTGGNIPVQPAMPAQAPNPMAALLKAQASQSPEGRAYIAPLLANAIPKTPESVIEFNAMKDNPAYKAWKNQLTPMQEAQLKNEETRLKYEGQRVGLEGAKFSLEKQKIEQELLQGKPLTESQSKAVAYGIAMQDSSNNMKEIENKGFDPASLKNQSAISMANNPIGNIFVSSEARRYKQAQDQFAEAYLRFKSGANTPEPEIQRNLRNMMPAIGDDKAQVAQKQKARDEAGRAMSVASGPGANKIQNLQQSGQPNVQVTPSVPSKVVNFNDLK